MVITQTRLIKISLVRFVPIDILAILSEALARISTTAHIFARKLRASGDCIFQIVKQANGITASLGQEIETKMQRTIRNFHLSILSLL